MNYVELHLRDYEAATSHLSWDEDQAYTRLLRWYYRKERPIPAEIPEACRQVRATSPAQRRAVETVLREFFELRPDGWHQDTCDEVIAEFQAGAPEREQKKVNEDTRLKRHREERAALFKVLNDHGQHAPWNTKIEELRRLAAPFKAATATAPATPPETQMPLPATAPATPATATHGNASPLPTPQYPEEEREEGGSPRARPREGPEGVRTGEVPPEASGHQPPAAGLAGTAIRAAGIPDVTPGHPGLLRLLEGGVTAQQLADTATELAGKGKAKFALLLATVDGRLRDAAAAGAVPAGAPPPDPWTTRGGVEGIAATLGLPKWDECETFDAYRATVRKAQQQRNPQPEGAVQ